MNYITAALMAAVLCTAACRPTRYVPLSSSERVDARHEVTVSEAELKSLIAVLISSVTVADSTVINERITVNEYGDTLRVDREKEHYNRTDARRDNIVAARDSGAVSSREVGDSIREKQTDTPVPVERELSWWERARINIGTVTVYAGVVVLCAVILWIIFKRRRK